MNRDNISEKNSHSIKTLYSYIESLSEKAVSSCYIDPSLYQKYEVKRGLRDISGKGVLAGLTEIAEVHAYVIDEGEMVPCDGKLYYRGINIEDLTKGFTCENRFGFEETVYLLLFGQLPNKEELEKFCKLLNVFRMYNSYTLREIATDHPSANVMNTIARSVLTLYSYDSRPDDTSIANVLRQSINLISKFPSICVYGYQAYENMKKDAGHKIRLPIEGLSSAENILYLLRPGGEFTDFEAKVLDLALVLHAEHGGGNNSTFTTHVVTSSGTDTYSAIAAALGSLKGPRHGGANIKVVEMMEDAKRNISDWTNEKQIEDYIYKLLCREAFDQSGLVYGIGHAVYSLSDPRARIFKSYVEDLAIQKGYSDEFELYSKFEKLAPDVIAHVRKMYKGVSANVDFYSGFVYRMLNIPPELYTPIFATARVAGWCAHRIEEIANKGKIIRPAYKSIAKHTGYTPIQDRQKDSGTN